MEHQLQRLGGRDAQRTCGHLSGQHGGTVLKSGKLHGIGRICSGKEHPPERKGEVLGGDGVVGGAALCGGIGQTVFQIKCIGAPVGGHLPPFAQLGGQLAVRRAADEAAVEVLAGDDVGGAGCHLWVEVRGDGIHEPCKAVGAGAAGGEAQDKKRSQQGCDKAKLSQEMHPSGPVALFVIKSRFKDRPAPGRAQGDSAVDGAQCC